MLAGLVDDVDELLVKSHRRPHQSAASRHLLLPLSLEAQFVRDVVDRVRILTYYCKTN